MPLGTHQVNLREAPPAHGIFPATAVGSSLVSPNNRSKTSAQGYITKRDGVTRRLKEPQAGTSLLCIIVGLAIPLIVVVFKIRKLQKPMMEIELYDRDTWGYGQSVSGVILGPAFVQLGYQWRFRGTWDQEGMAQSPGLRD